MMIINVDNKEYTLRFGIKASMHKDLVNRMFKILTGAYVIRETEKVQETKSAIGGLLDGVADMVADIPETVMIAWQAGLEQYHPMDTSASYDLLEKYMVESGKNFANLYEDLKNAMEDDGFFELSGLKAMIDQMNQTEQTAQKKPKTAKAPADHKTKTGTK
jgi:hypothetical protein